MFNQAALLSLLFRVGLSYNCVSSDLRPVPVMLRGKSNKIKNLYNLLYFNEVCRCREI